MAFVFMAFSVALPFALSAIQSLIRFRGRVDTILSLKETTEPLPFLLPDAPIAHAPHVKGMLAYFETENGKGILALEGLEATWKVVKSDPQAALAGNLQAVLRLLTAYYNSAGIQPDKLSPIFNDDRLRLQHGATDEVRLAFYVVRSERLSRNPAVTRVLLAAADTLLEFGADHATQMIGNPRTRGLVQSLLKEFAQNRDWDDAGAGSIFKTLLGSTAAAVLQNPEIIPDEPVAKVLFAALGDVEKEEGADFVAKIVTREGFQSLLGRCLVQSAQQPGLLPDNPLLQPALAAMLKTAGENLNNLLLREPGSLEAVIEAGIAAAANAAVPILERKLGDEPLLSVTMKAVLVHVQNAAAANNLIKIIADGSALGAIYKVALQSVAQNPQALASQAGLDEHVAALISSLAKELAKAGPDQLLSATTLRTLASHTLETVASHPELLGVRQPFTAKVIAAALSAAAQAGKNGFSPADLPDIADAVVRAAAANSALVRLDDRIAPIVGALAGILSHEGIAAIASPTQRRVLFTAALGALQNNPRIWGDLAAEGAVAPILQAVLDALAKDPTGLVSGAALDSVFTKILQAIALRGRRYLEEKIPPATIRTLIERALTKAGDDLGRTVDETVLPAFLGEVIREFLATSLDLGEEAAFDAWLDQRLAAVAA